MDIKTYVLNQKESLRQKIKEASQKPNLTIIQVNDDFASDKYIAGKLKDAKEVGMDASLIKLDIATPESEVVSLIEQLNRDKRVHGIIVQLPLPKHISETRIKHSISPTKDVDGFHPLSKFKACTPLGIVNYLKAEKHEIRSKNVVILGRSNIVGKPAALLFLEEDANVTILHSKTLQADREYYLRNADIVVVAVGIKHFLDYPLLKKSAIVVDVGINRSDDGTLTGDVKPGLDVLLQTPVPGGVGLLTRLTLLENVWEAFIHGI